MEGLIKLTAISSRATLIHEVVPTRLSSKRLKLQAVRQLPPRLNLARASHAAPDYERQQQQQPQRQEQQRRQKQQLDRRRAANTSSTEVRPKSFQELLQLQHQRSDGNANSRDNVESDGINQKYEDNSSSSSLTSSSFSPSERERQSDNVILRRLRSIDSRVRSFVDNVVKWDERLEQKLAKRIDEAIPGYRFEIVYRNALHYADAREIMTATYREMFFFGHPFRGATFLSAAFTLFFVPATLQLLDYSDSVHSFAGLSGCLSMYFYFKFYLGKLSCQLWHSEEKDVYILHLPFRFPFSTRTKFFKAGHVTEINDFLANLSIRGDKVYCPSAFFKDVKDYENLVKITRRRCVIDVVTVEKK